MPGEWDTVELQEVADVNSESLGADTSQEFTFKYIDISSVTQGVVNWNTVQQLVFRTAPSRARRILRKDDFLLCTVRPGLEAHTAAPWANRENFVASTGFAVIRSHRNLNPRFLAQLAFSPLVANQLRAREVGSNYPAVTERDVRQLSIPLPPLTEQRRIAEVLDTLDTVVERTEALVQKLKLARAGLLHDLLTRGLDEQGQLRDPDRNPEAFKDSELGRVPNTWALGRVEDFGEVRLGRQRSPQQQSGRHTTPYLRVANVHDCRIDFSDVLEMDFTPAERAVYGLLPGDILLNEGQSLELVGRPAMYEGAPGKYCFQNTLVRFRCNQQLLPAFSLAVFKTYLDTGIFMQIASQTTSIAHLGTDRFAKLLISVPAITEQAAIAKILHEDSARLTAEQAQLDKLRQLKRGLMEDLLTGRVRVPMPEEKVEDDNARTAVRPPPVPPTLPAMTDMPPPVPMVAQPPAMYRASPGANPAAQGAWVEQVRAAVARQQVGTYSPKALDALLPELAALSVEPECILRIPELLAGMGIRFMLLSHPVNSRTSGAAFYLDEPTRTQPVVALSFLRPYLDAFWFNLFHELGHIRLGHAPVFDEELGGKGYADSDEEQAANAFARHVLIPEEVWQPFLAAGLHDSYRIRSFARKVGRHHGTVAGRLGTDTGDWPKFNSPELRPQVKPLLTELAARLKL